tara:strand:- start:2805 stop:3176 length:372 start_codon:yes stop_codon:yes gene_type:complete
MQITSRELLATNVRRIRRGQGLTQQKLAEIMDRAQARISEIERGSHPVSDRHLDLLAEALVVPVSCLLEEEHHAARLPDEESGPEYPRRVHLEAGGGEDMDGEEVPPVHGAGADHGQDTLPEV